MEYTARAGISARRCCLKGWTRLQCRHRDCVSRCLIASLAHDRNVKGANMTRTALTTVAAASLAIVLAMPAQAQQRPQIETKKVDGTDNVYIFRNGGHQSMFVVTSAGVIATDPVAYGRPT